MDANPKATVADNPSERRYEARVGDELAGFAQYHAQPGQISFTHTEVDDRFEGQGVGSRLASFALEDARRRGLAVLPFCPFINGYIKRHPEYAELVPEERRAGFGL
jgi:predicted GNAT family acetyltransferase